MMCDRSSGGLMALVLAACLAVCLVALPASAQSLLSQPLQPQPPRPQSPWPKTMTGEDADPPAAPAATAEADEPEVPAVDPDKLDWSQLDVDASTLGDLKARSASTKAAHGDVTWVQNRNADGTSAVSVKQSLSPFWDTRVGADMTVARQPTTMSELLAEKADNGGSVPQSSGTAWASITAPGPGSIWDKTAVEARIDPTQDQSRLGTSISKSVPLPTDFALTLQNGYSLTEQGAVPVPGIGLRAVRAHETDQSAKLTIGDTGASVVAGQSLSSADDKWLRKLGAEQNLADGVTISGSIGETAVGATSKSIVAGYKRSW